MLFVLGCSTKKPTPPPPPEDTTTLPEMARVDIIKVDYFNGLSDTLTIYGKPYLKDGTLYLIRSGKDTLPIGEHVVKYEVVN